MSWSFKLVRVFGIEIRLHALFGLLVLWQAIVAYTTTGTAGGVLSSVGFIGVLFFVIVLHELGHALTARQFGIRTVDITLLPIGGLARLERMPEKPWQELLVALAGPAVNVVLAAALALAHLAAGMPLVPTDPALPFVTSLLYANVALAAFNLLPAFPMDGGRVLRAALALRGDPVRATRVAARVGQALALLLGIVGLFSNTMLVVIALFVWFGAAAELASVELKAALRGLPVEWAMLKACDPLSPSDTLDTAAKLTIAHGHRDFPVVDAEGRVVGALTGRKLVEGLATMGATARVAQVMDTRIEVADVARPIEEALAKLEASPAGILVVLGEGRVQGLISRETIQQLALFREADDFARRHVARPRTTTLTPSAA